MTPEAYFGSIRDLLARLEATDASGKRLDLEVATNDAVRCLLDAKDAGRKVLLIGNGGSSAIASHMQSDLSKSLGVRALVFHDIPLLTATVNDDGYERVFAQPLELWTETEDVLIAVSSSGRSANILRAVDAVLTRGARVVTLSGFHPGNPLRQRGDLNFWVGSDNYGLVETAHTILTHYLADCAVETSKAKGES